MSHKVNLGMTLYDFNKQAMKEEKPLDPILLNTKIQDIVTDIRKTSKFWMLLNNERHDYTVFVPLTVSGTVEELKETLQNRGQVLSIDKLEDGNYEIWIRDPQSKENFVYYLFDYTFGIVEA